MIRGLGAVTVVAVASAWWQLSALVGPHGILPSPWAPFDLVLHLACAGTMACALALTLGAPGELALCLATALGYWLICLLGQVFFNFQWDSLLIEALALSALMARVRPGDQPTRELGLWALRLLIFKLMLQSGLAKVLASDGRWLDLSAMQYHYWTQPLPNGLSRLAASLPGPWHMLESAYTLAVELLAPWLIFAGRRARLLAVALFASLMLGLGLTGNYGFFQLLTLVLLLALLDDGWLGPLARRPAEAPAKKRAKRTEPATSPAWLASPRAKLSAGLLTLWLLGSALTHLGRFHGASALPGPLVSLARATFSTRLANAYGLFGTMTVQRPQVELEGSADGETWKPYALPYQPGPLDRAPGQIAPHMPRLDWQLWFVALYPCDPNGWFIGLEDALLRGEPSVRGLFATDPFPDAPPRMIRSTRWLYAYAPSDDRKHRVWQRTGAGPVCPIRSASDATHPAP